MEYYFSKVIGLHSTILLEQDPIRDILKFFKAFRAASFIRTATSELTNISHIFYPLLPRLYIETTGFAKTET